MKHKLYLYPKWIRAWHTINALLFIILIMTGLSMQYTGKDNAGYIITFAKAVRWHNVAAFILTANYIFFVAGNVLTRNGKYYRIEKPGGWPDLLKQLRYYAFGMFKKKNPPFQVTEERKFNPLQKFTYVIAMYIGMPLLILSGMVLLFPEIAINRLFGMSGLVLNDILHITMGFLLSVFMIVHIYTCTLGEKPGTLFKGMITGYHEVDEH